MVSYAPRSELRGLIHVPRMFGWLLKQPRGDVAARRITRLGLAGMQVTPFAIELPNRREARISAESVLRGDLRGAVSAIGPSISTEWPDHVPTDARGFFQASVIPAHVLRAVFFYLSAENPLQLTLIQAQLSALENQIGKGLDADVLGTAAKRWTVYGDKRGVPVGRLELADPQGAKELAEAAFRAFPSLAPKEAQWGDVTGFRVQTPSGKGAVAFGPNAIWMSVDEAGLKRALRVEAPEEKPTLLVPGRGVVFGQGDDLLRGVATALRLPSTTDRTTDHSGFRIERDRVSGGAKFLFRGRVRR